MQIIISDSKINPDKQTSEAVCFRGLFFVPTSGSKVFFCCAGFCRYGIFVASKGDKFLKIRIFNIETLENNFHFDCKFLVNKRSKGLLQGV